MLRSHGLFRKGDSPTSAHGRHAATANEGNVFQRPSDRIGLSELDVESQCRCG